MSRASVDEILAAAVAETARPGQGDLICLGPDVPRALVLAAGLTPWRMAGGWSTEPSGQPLRDILAADCRAAGLLIDHSSQVNAQVFASLRELQRTGRGPACPFAFIDILHRPGEATRSYVRRRLTQAAEWLGRLTGRTLSDDDLADAIGRIEQGDMRARACLARWRGAGLVTGTQAQNLVLTLRRLSPERGAALLDTLEGAMARQEANAGPRLYVTGSPHPEGAAVYRAIEAAGAVIVGEDHDGGLPPVPAVTGSSWDRVTETAQSADRARPTGSARARAEAVVRDARALGVQGVIHCGLGADESAPWEVKALSALCAETGLTFLSLRSRSPDRPPEDLTERVQAFLEGRADAPAPARSPIQAQARPQPRPTTSERSRKALACTADFRDWQRQWFADVQTAAASGPFAVVNADAPQEILRALDIPYVVNQWWASIVAAKRRSGDYGRLLEGHGYPSRIETYSAQGLAAALDRDVETAPWGGLPRPTLLSLVANSDAGPKLFEAWAEETDADLFVFERSIDGRLDLPVDWWADLPEGWDQALEAERLDLMEAELRRYIETVETATGRRLHMGRLVEVMTLVNEQEVFYRRTRDLIARTRPTPVSIVDTMPATMVPQWHRGTTWGRDAARRVFEEVSRKADAGDAVCADERLRLLWVGRGLWGDTGFYQHWEESHGAVFVWSMYLGLAADGYIREFQGEHDVLRALAARFVTMGDELRMPTWSGAWHVKEARLHGVQGAVAIDDADPLVLDALERAGIPVCRLEMGNMAGGSDEARAKVTTFLDCLGGAVVDA